MIEPAIRRSEADDLVNQASQDIRERDRQRAARKPVDPTRSGQRASLIGLLVAIPVLVAVLIPKFTAWSWMSLFETRPPAVVAREEAQKTLNALVVQVEGFRNHYHQLPESLAEVGLPAHGRWSYSVRGDGQYRLTVNLYGQAVNSESPTPARSR